MKWISDKRKCVDEMNSIWKWQCCENSAIWASKESNVGDSGERFEGLIFNDIPYGIGDIWWREPLKAVKTVVDDLFL